MSNINDRAVLSLSELTETAIKEETESLAHLGNRPTTSLIDAVRKHLQVWETQLFPLLRMKKIARNEFLAELLQKAGYINVTANHVSVMISKARKEGYGRE
jgi:hypothetical protein